MERCYLIVVSVEKLNALLERPAKSVQSRTLLKIAVIYVGIPLRFAPLSYWPPAKRRGIYFRSCLSVCLAVC